MFPLKIKLKTEKAKKRGVVPEGSVERAGSWLHAGRLPGALLLVTESPRCVGLGGLPEAGHAPRAVTGGVGRGRQSTGSGPAEAMSLIFSADLEG